MAKETKTNSVEVGSAFDLLGKSYEIVKKNWQAFLFVNILTLLSSLASIFDNDPQAGDPDYTIFPSSGTPTGFELGTILGVVGALVFVFAVINIFLYLMAVVLETWAASGKKPTISELANKALEKSLSLIGLFILLVIIGVASFLLLIIPFIFVLPRLVMAPYIMIDKNLGVMDSLSESFRLGKAFFGKIWGAIGVTILIVIAAGIVSAVPVIGPIAGALIVIAFSLVLPLRYFQLKNLKVTASENK